MPMCSLPCHCCMSNSSLCLCCESKVRTLVSQWVCMLAHLEFFMEGVSHILYCCCNPSCIKLDLYMLIGNMSHVTNHMLQINWFGRSHLEHRLWKMKGILINHDHVTNHMLQIISYLYGRCLPHSLLLLQSKLHQIGPLHADW